MAPAQKPPDRPSGQYSQTHVGPGERLVAPRPGARPKPKLPELPVLEPPPSEAIQTPRSGAEPETWVIPPTASTREATQLEQAARSHGARVVRPPVTPPSDDGSRRDPPGETPWWRSAKGVVTVLGAAGTFVGVVTLAAVQIINALKQPDVANAQLRELRAESEIRKAEARAREPIEAARAAAEQRARDAINARLIELDLRYPAPKRNPRRAPQPADQPSE